MKKALIIQNKFIGDVLVASLLAKNLKRIIPNIEVHFFCYDTAKAVLEQNPYIDKIIYFEDHRLKNIGVLTEYAWEIRKEKYDYLFDLYSKLQSRYITLFSGAQTKISYDKPIFKPLYDYNIKEKEKPEFVCCTSIENRLRLLTPLEKDMSTYDFETEIFLKIEERKKARREMEIKGVDFSKPTFMIGALGSSSTKSLPLDSMAELINHLLNHYEGNFVLNYVPNQQNEIDRLLQKIPKSDQLKTNILGKNVRDMLAILSQCDVLIANEGGAVNMAKALKIPTFSIYSPHKFREDWACYENQFIHESVHLEDLDPGYVYQMNLQATIKDPTHLYKKLKPDFINKKLDQYLRKIGIFNQTTPQLKTPKPFEPKISALLITKNEEKNIASYLRDMDFADEIIIVDSLSTDETKRIATNHQNVRFLERKFDNFSNQKNFAIEQAQYPWIVFFDTDERVSRKLKSEILNVVHSENPLDAYFVRRKFYFLEDPMHFSGWQNDKAIRLFKNGKGKYCNEKFVHETLEVDGEVGILNEAIHHYSLNDLEAYQEKLKLYAKLKAEELYKKGKKASFIHYHIKPSIRFLHHFVFRFGFLDGKNGYTIAKIYRDYVVNRYTYLDQYWAQDIEN